MKKDKEYGQRVEAFVKKVKDINEFLWEQIDSIHFLPLRVAITYQDSCHLANGQGIREQPRNLLKAIPEATYLEFEKADTCCGSAGIYNITNFDTSMEILDNKMEKVKKTKARYVVTANPGCLLQMKVGVQRAGLEGEMEAVHIVDLLDRVMK
ncbi:MAG: (Fe-S)-binding protein [Bacillaceae bacterium]